MDQVTVKNIIIILSALLLIAIIVFVGFSMSGDFSRVQETGTPAVTPEPATEAPETESPATEAPVVTTQAPETTAEITTEAPVITTAEPVVTTQGPVQTVIKPITIAPVTTAPAPVTRIPDTTVAPITTAAPETRAPVTTKPETFIVIPSENTSGSQTKTVDAKGYLKYSLDWKVVSATYNEVTVRFAVRITVTSISMGGRTATLTVNGTEYTIDCDAVNAKYLGAGKRNDIEIGSIEIRLPLQNGKVTADASLSFPLQFTFSGTYYNIIKIDELVDIR